MDGRGTLHNGAGVCAGEEFRFSFVSPVIIFLTWQVTAMHVWMSMQPLLLHGQSLELS